MKTLRQSHSIAISTKVRLLRSVVWPVVSYGCESWTLKKSDEKRITPLRRKHTGQLGLLRVSWTDKRSNDWLLQKAETKPRLLQAIKKRKLTFYGHVSQKEGSCMEKEIIHGTKPGHRCRGRPKTS